jgi:hypothetical protein
MTDHLFGPTKQHLGGCKFHTEVHMKTKAQLPWQQNFCPCQDGKNASTCSAIKLKNNDTSLQQMHYM